VAYSYQDHALVRFSLTPPFNIISKLPIGQGPNKITYGYKRTGGTASSWTRARAFSRRWPDGVKAGHARGLLLLLLLALPRLLFAQEEAPAAATHWTLMLHVDQVKGSGFSDNDC